MLFRDFFKCKSDYTVTFNNSKISKIALDSILTNIGKLINQNLKLFCVIYLEKYNKLMFYLDNPNLMTIHTQEKGGHKNHSAVQRTNGGQTGGSRVSN